MLVWLLMYFQDPLGNYSGEWYVYNSYLPNLGSWTTSVPGWMPAAKPGAMSAGTSMIITSPSPDMTSHARAFHLLMEAYPAFSK